MASHVLCMLVAAGGSKYGVRERVVLADVRCSRNLARLCWALSSDCWIIRCGCDERRWCCMMMDRTHDELCWLYCSSLCAIFKVLGLSPERVVTLLVLRDSRRHVYVVRVVQRTLALDTGPSSSNSMLILPAPPAPRYHRPSRTPPPPKNGGDKASSTTPPRRGFISLGWQAPANAGAFKSKVLAGHQGPITCASSHPRRVDGKPWLAVSG